MSIDPVTGKRGRGRPRKSEEAISMQAPIPGAFLNRGNIAALVCSMCGRGAEVDLNAVPRWTVLLLRTGRGIHCAVCGGVAWLADAGPRSDYHDPMATLGSRADRSVLVGSTSRVAHSIAMLRG